MIRDLDALQHDCRLDANNSLNFQGEPQWNGSMAHMLLKADLNGGYDGTPKDLYDSRVEYHPYPLHVRSK
jgi:hypothetical protein